MTKYRVRYLVKDPERLICFEDSLVLQPSAFSLSVKVNGADVSMFAPLVAAYLQIVTPELELVEIESVKPEGIQPEWSDVRFAL